MKPIFIIIILLTSFYSYGQRYRRSYNGISETVRKGDSLEVLYSTDSILSIINDTLPPILDENDDESSGWRNVRLIKYYYDQSSVVKKIEYASRKEGTINFYFEGTYIRKIRVLKEIDLINIQFYYDLGVNISSWELIQILIEKSPEKKEYYETYLLGKELQSKFNKLLKTKK